MHRSNLGTSMGGPMDPQAGLRSSAIPEQISTQCPGISSLTRRNITRDLVQTDLIVSFTHPVRQVREVSSD